MKLCTDCNHYDSGACKFKYVTPATGEEFQGISANHAREVGQYCGYVATHFSSISAVKKAIHLEISETNSLQILYGNKMLGFISKNGKCQFLNCGSMVEGRQAWLDEGARVDMNPVSWLERKYFLSDDGCLWSVGRLYKPAIYNIYKCCTYEDCTDENLMRFPDNGRIILF